VTGLGPQGGAEAVWVACSAMEPAAALQVIRHQHHAVLATARGDGRPQLSPVSAGVLGDPELGDIVVISSRETAMKVHNLRQRPFASLCVFPDTFYGSWVQVEGPTDVVSLPAAMEQLVEYYRAVAGEHPDWDEYRGAMEDERRVVIRMTVQRAGPDRSG
jgi:PPOX class probable F420-dependent enzyme